MAEEWNPNAPNLNKSFNNARENKNEQEKLREDTVTKSEAQKLEQDRDTPRAENVPAPPGGAAYTAEYQQQAIKREERIKYIKERMAASQERLKEGWDNSRK